MGISRAGLGMTVVWATVKDHIGYIELKSTGGVGTEIILYFPVTRQTKEALTLGANEYMSKLYTIESIATAGQSSLSSLN